ncbi:hypothetical protein I79_003010 [Cricetulus griseus]|uniref:Uncharacterized protein n=1 Tax=Cricetulus griseus TaxID=10029 RepID=G3GYV6_CRIGR|nr:hypothetical protein I79_003010 [Cricetulus griseus]
MAQQLRALDALLKAGFNSQHPHGSLQLSVIPRSDTVTQTYIHAGKTSMHIKKI